MAEGFPGVTVKSQSTDACEVALSPAAPFAPNRTTSLPLKRSANNCLRNSLSYFAFSEHRDEPPAAPTEPTFIEWRDVAAQRARDSGLHAVDDEAPAAAAEYFERATGAGWVVGRREKDDALNAADGHGKPMGLALPDFLRQGACIADEAINAGAKARHRDIGVSSRDGDQQTVDCLDRDRAVFLDQHRCERAEIIRMIESEPVERAPDGESEAPRISEQ